MEKNSLLAVIYNCRRWGWGRFFPKALWRLWIHPGDSLEQMIPSCQSQEFSYSWEVRRCVWIQRCYRAQKGSKITVDGDCSHEVKRLLLLGSKTMRNLDSILKNRDIILLTKVHMVKAMVFSLVTYGCKSWTVKEAGMLKNWCFQIVVLKKALESRLDSKEIKPVNPKGNQPWMFIGRTDAKVETPVLWPLDVRVDSLEKTLMLGKIESRNRKGRQRMKWLDGLSRCEFEQTLGDSEEQGSLACCSPWGHRVGHDLLNNNNRARQTLKFWHYSFATCFSPKQ